MSASSRCDYLLNQIDLLRELPVLAAEAVAPHGGPDFDFEDGGGHLVVDDDILLLLGDDAVYDDPFRTADLQCCQFHRPRFCFHLAFRHGFSMPVDAVPALQFPPPHPKDTVAYLCLHPIVLDRLGV